MHYKQYQHKQWIYYLTFSFWKLYQSETTAINYFRSKFNIELKFTDHNLDVKYGYDFTFEYQGLIYYLIVKHKLNNDFFKDKFYFHEVLVFDTHTLCLYDSNANPIEHIAKHHIDNNK